MPAETQQWIRQQPMDNPFASNRNYPFPAVSGLAKPARPAAAPVHRVGLHLVGSEENGSAPAANTISASPFHGVTRLAIVADGQVSQYFNNGKGDVDGAGQVRPGGKRGRYFQEVEEIIPLNSMANSLKICWKVRNTDQFQTVKFELFAPQRPTAIWSLTWDKNQIAANIDKGALVTTNEDEDGVITPMAWSGSLDWSAAIQITDPAFADGLLSADPSPYQLRITVNDNDPGPARMGYPLVAWTYFYVVGDGAAETTQPAYRLAVQLLYQGIPMAGMSVRFYTLTADNQQGYPLGPTQVTDADGTAMLADVVELAYYGCAIENQPLALIIPVTDPADPAIFSLPIGTAQNAAFLNFDDDLDEAEDEETAVQVAEVEGGEETQPPAVESAQTWLVIQVVYRGIPLADKTVQFYTLTADHQQGQPFGARQVTDAEGLAGLNDAVEWAYYGCLIEDHSLAFVTPIEDPTEPFTVTLPIGEPQIEAFGLVGDDLDQAEEGE